ncbi:hypothetical protein P152DRAFT_109810 [Eremomyces bilateralis CBS 781.70]|uniref:Uncharacterized protein n=1 Tax=Eremomyces bilateralis CBS 781.70 TaxID=1392243 RepID=A0A6G1GDT1_9PEZI|nr:uncharacterized protein P152DRAFT_109810 [Eremomyces bilateralis CBS 781.70]KAF1816066.1 hypothetical protein P152DRAFT_109810 [Eremomyces bilateralis CBS 781.70]
MARNCMPPGGEQTGSASAAGDSSTGGSSAGDSAAGDSSAGDCSAPTDACPSTALVPVSLVPVVVVVSAPVSADSLPSASTVPSPGIARCGISFDDSDGWRRCSNSRSDERRSCSSCWSGFLKEAGMVSERSVR